MRKLAIEAGALIMEVYGRPDFEISTKDDASPVTEADQLADRHIGAGLREAFPEIALVTEEQAESHGVVAEDFFIVDPLDGTKEFIKRGGDFTVNIALVRARQPVLGIVYAPAIGRLFYTDAAGGAVEETGEFAADAPGPTAPIRVAAPDHERLRVVASKSHRDAATDAYISKYAVGAFKSAGSSLKFCLVAAGEADLYPRLGRTMEWDTAAGDAILRAAGGRMVFFDDLAPFHYAKPDFANPFFIAAAPGFDLLAP
ncbi:MAG: 3'(2'),5'-bisphosphate nucleotidase CysQ [Pseudomonadota bacterium]